EEVNDKHRYSGIARAPLSDLELLLLYYNCLMPQSERFKPLAEKYALFDSLPIDLLLDKRHLAFVDPMAWGGQEGAVRKRFEHLSMSRISVDSEA
ncbi:putative phage abortive infection protein, partial [uncultured Lamprocystis sp.]|uniref:putative phage abortive infection protein n=1 Tax=uncultured Lamprocystis sp. TaxID=543132 RepID=UPI0025EAD568